MKTTGNIFCMILIMSFLLTITSCQKEYAKYDNMEVVENTFTGNVQITSSGQDPAGDFTGNNGNSGTYSFAWENSKKKASANFNITGGTVQMIIKDAKGDEVLNETRSSSGNDTFAGVSTEGKPGTWLVTLIINFTQNGGDGSFSVHPGS